MSGQIWRDAVGVWMVLAGLLFGAVILMYRSGGVAEPRRRRVLTEAQAVGYRAAFGECPSTMTLREDSIGD